MIQVLRKPSYVYSGKKSKLDFTRCLILQEQAYINFLPVSYFDEFFITYKFMYGATKTNIRRMIYVIGTSNAPYGVVATRDGHNITALYGSPNGGTLVSYGLGGKDIILPHSEFLPENMPKYPNLKLKLNKNYSPFRQSFFFGEVDPDQPQHQDKYTPGHNIDNNSKLVIGTEINFISNHHFKLEYRYAKINIWKKH